MENEISTTVQIVILAAVFCLGWVLSTIYGMAQKERDEFR